MKTLHSQHRGVKRGQQNPHNYKIQISLTKEISEQLQEYKWVLEQQQKSAVSWSVFFLHCADAFAEAMKEGKATKMFQASKAKLV